MKILVTETQLKKIILKEQSYSKVKKDFTYTWTGKKNIARQSLWDFIKKEENLILYTYDDKRKWKSGRPVLYSGGTVYGKLTIGYGHTGKDVTPDQKISESEANKLLKTDVNNAARCVRQFLTEWKDAELSSFKVTQGMYEAMISLAFNTGCDSIRTSEWIQDVKKQKYKHMKRAC